MALLSPRGGVSSDDFSTSNVGLLFNRQQNFPLFEAVIHNPSRFSYLLDFLLEKGQSHTLLFWLEAEQLRAHSTGGGQGDGMGNEDLAGRREAAMEKYFAPKSQSRLNLPPDIMEITRRLHETGCPTGLTFNLAQAFVHTELHLRWFKLFLASPIHNSLRKHLCMNYPISIPQLLVSDDMGMRSVLNRFIKSPRDCPKDVASAFKIWSLVSASLKPLCSSIFKVLGEKGAIGASPALAHLAEELGKFLALVQEEGESCVSLATRTLLESKSSHLQACTKDIMLDASPGADAESVRQSVSAVGDALMKTQQEAYKVVDFRLLPAFRRSRAFGDYVEEAVGLDCPSLQARFELLNFVADVLRRRSRRLIPYWLRTPGDNQERLIHLSIPRSASCAIKESGLGLEHDKNNELFVCCRMSRNAPLSSVPMSPQEILKREWESMDPLSRFRPGSVLLRFRVNVVEEECGESREGGAQHGQISNRLRGLLPCKEKGAEAENCSRGSVVTRVQSLQHCTIATVFRRANVESSFEDTRHLGASPLTDPEDIGFFIGTGARPGDESKESSVNSSKEQLIDLIDSGIMDILPSYSLPREIFVIRGENDTPPVPSIHHFVLTLRRSRSQGGRGRRLVNNDRHRSGPKGPSQGGANSSAPPCVAADWRANHVLFGACHTQWVELGDRDQGSRSDSVTWVPRCTVALGEEKFVDVLRYASLEASEGVLREQVSLAFGKPRGIPSHWVLTRNLQPMDHPLAPTFHSLSPGNILNALKWLALERSVVVTGSCRSLITCTCEVLCALLHPLKWCSTYVPLLPASQVSSIWEACLKEEELQGSRRSPRSRSPTKGGGETKFRGIGAATKSALPFFVGMDVELLYRAGCIEKEQAQVDGHHDEVWGLKRMGAEIGSQLDHDDHSSAVKRTLESVRGMASKSLIINLDLNECIFPDSGEWNSSRTWPKAPLKKALGAIQKSLAKALSMNGGSSAGDNILSPYRLGEAVREHDDGDGAPEDDSPANGASASGALGKDPTLVPFYSPTLEESSIEMIVHELMQEIFSPMCEFISADVENGVSRFDSGSYLAGSALVQDESASELMRELYLTECFAVFIADVIGERFDIRDAQQKLVEWGTALAGGGDDNSG